MLNKVLNEEFIKTNETVSSWREAIHACAESLLKHEKITDAYVSSMIETVESMGPYMILLPGIAFFHGVPGSTVKEVCLSLVTFEQPVVFEEFNSAQINAAFAFGAVDKNSHMKLLSELAMLLQDEEFVDLLRTNGSKQRLLEKIKNY